MNHVNINLLSTKYRLNSPYTRASPNFFTEIRWSRDRIDRAPSNKLKYFCIFCIFFNTHATLGFIPHHHFTVNKISFHFQLDLGKLWRMNYSRTCRKLETKKMFLIRWTWWMKTWFTVDLNFHGKHENNH